MHSVKLLYLWKRIKGHRLLCANQAGRIDVFWKLSFCVSASAVPLQREQHCCAGWLLQLNTALPCCVPPAGRLLRDKGKADRIRRILDETQESSCNEKGRNLPCAFCAEKGGCDGH